MANDGLLLGAAILGGGYLAINALGGEDGGEDGGGGGGSGPGGVVNIIESVKDAAAAAQGATKIVKDVSYFFERVAETVDDTKGAFDNGKSWLDDFMQPASSAPTGDKAPFFETASNAGGGFGAGIGGALGSAFLGLYGGAATAGAHFVGRQDVNPQNALNKFKTTLPGAKDNINSALTNATVDVLTAKAQRQFAGSILNETKARITGGGSSSSRGRAIPRIMGVPKGTKPAVVPGQMGGTTVLSSIRTTATPRTVRTTEAKKTIYGSVRSWFN